MKEYDVNKVKNIAFAGHNGSGKTSLAEALLFKAGASDRLGKTVDGTTICDYDPEEIKRKISIGTSLASFEYNDFKINLLDTPGLFDFAAEMIEGIRAADTVMITVSAKSGVKVGARKAYDEAVKQGKEVYFHLAVDTGMGRIGVKSDESSIDLVKEIFSLPNVVSEGIFTHFAKADEPGTMATERQIGSFRDYIFLLEGEGINFRLKHCSNSAGIVLYPEANMDLVRIGIVMYGMWPSDEVPLDPSCVRPVLELKSHIVYIKSIAPGDEVSYGGTYVAVRNRKVATIPVGYGDGYPRSLSNRGYVLIRGYRAPILGRVCMDQFMVDVSDIPDVSEGDTVTLIGTDGDRYISAEELGRLSGRFNYELICDLGSRVPRIYTKRGETLLFHPGGQDGPLPGLLGRRRPGQCMAHVLLDGDAQ